MNDRTCIVTRKQAEPDELIRFVVGPDSAVVPDIKRNLPGRGCWVSADRLHIDKAAAKNLFARAFKAQVVVPVVLGAAKVEAAVRDGQALLVLHATEASDDGVRKISQARRATVHLGGPAIPAYKLFPEAELSLALGGTNVIHAAVLAGDAGKAVQKRMVALDRYRGGTPDDLAMLAAVADEDEPAEDME